MSPTVYAPRVTDGATEPVLSARQLEVLALVARGRSTDGIAVELTGAQINKLAEDSHVTAITPDARVRLSGENDKWPYVVGAQRYWGSAWSSPAPAATIAIVDSGIDASRSDFSTRVIANVNLSTLSGNSAGDGRGHGTMVAGIAAGAAANIWLE